MKKLLLALVPAVLALAACSTAAAGTPHPVGTMASTTETLSASVSGKAAAAVLNSNGALRFPAGTLSGLVDATITPLTLGGGNGCTGRTTWITSQGALAVTHTSAPGSPCGKNSNAPPPALWEHSGKTCHFEAVFSKGTFAEIGGKLASTTWHGTYLITADGYAPLKGKTCSFPNIGAVRSKGASVKFTATGAMTK